MFTTDELLQSCILGCWRKHRRFLYKPEKYPNTAFMVSMMDQVLGKDRSDVCYFGFEANAVHYKRLHRLTQHYNTKNAQIWNQPVAVHNKNVTFYHANTDEDYMKNEGSLKLLGQRIAYPSSRKPLTFRNGLLRCTSIPLPQYW